MLRIRRLAASIVVKFLDGIQEVLNSSAIKLLPVNLEPVVPVLLEPHYVTNLHPKLLQLVAVIRHLPSSRQGLF